MNKKTNIIIFLFLALSFFLGSCSSDNTDPYQVSEEWKAYQKSRVDDVIELRKQGIYTQRLTDYGPGMYIYERPSDFITNINDEDNPTFLEGGPIDGLEPVEETKAKALARTVDEKLEEVEYDTDIVVVRYHGYFYSLDGKRYVFDSNETDASGNKLNNPRDNTDMRLTDVVVEGFKTALYNMKVGDEKLVCIPYAMAYGVSGTTNQDGTVAIPGYTTLFFDIKLLEIKRDR